MKRGTLFERNITAHEILKTLTESIKKLLEEQGCRTSPNTKKNALNIY